jgi:hypothetical protein
MTELQKSKTVPNSQLVSLYMKLCPFDSIPKSIENFNGLNCNLDKESFEIINLRAKNEIIENEERFEFLQHVTQFLKKKFVGVKRKNIVC